MASLLISMAPSTHCSASMSCRGVRAASRGAPPPPARAGGLAHQQGTEHALLRLHVLRRRTVGKLGGAVPVGRHHLGQAHASPSLLSYRFGSESNASSEPTGTD